MDLFVFSDEELKPAHSDLNDEGSVLFRFVFIDLKLLELSQVTFTLSEDTDTNMEFCLIARKINFWSLGSEKY